MAENSPPLKAAMSKRERPKNETETQINEREYRFLPACEYRWIVIDISDDNRHVS